MRLTTPLVRRVIRETALEHPGTVEHERGDELVYEVNGTPYASLARDPKALAASFYLPESTANALTFPDTAATPGRDRWVTVRHRRPVDAQLDLLMTWVAESYAAITDPGRKQRSREELQQGRRARSRR